MELTRKGFLQSVALAGLGASACAAGMGVDGSVAKASEATSQNGRDAEEIGYDFEETFDVVVVGSGMAGLSAALRAKEDGLNVVLLEKNPVLGGTTLYTEGMFAVGTDMQKEIGYNVEPGELVQAIEEYSHWTNNERLVKRFVEHSGEGLNWIAGHGVRFSEIVPLGDALTWHIYEGSGKAAVESLTEAAQSIGVDIRSSMPGKSLVLDEDGSVRGVIAAGEDGNTLFTCKAVVLATGGISNNADMMRKYTYVDPDVRRVFGMDGRDGDGWNMGLSAGAALHCPCAVMESEAFVDGIMEYENHVYAASGGAPGLWVNQDAVRYCDEYNAASNFIYSGAVSGIQAKTFVISDTSFMERMRDEGIMVTVSAWLTEGTKLTDLMEKLDEAVADSKIGAYRADTLEELAEQLGLDPEALAHTVEQYNQYCKDGKDEEFRKNPDFLFAMEQPPYYGFTTSATYLTTVGGLKIDEYMRVVKQDGTAIPGLYALGGDAGGVYGYTYDVGAAAGSQQGFCVTGGMLAADHIRDMLAAE